MACRIQARTQYLQARQKYLVAIKNADEETFKAEHAVDDTIRFMSFLFILIQVWRLLLRKCDPLWDNLKLVLVQQ